MARIELDSLLSMNPLERPLDLQGANVILKFPDRAAVMKHWKIISPLLHSMSRERERHSWKIDRFEPISLTVKIEDGNEVRSFPGWDFEIEALEDIVFEIGAENIEVIAPSDGNEERS